MKALKSIVGKVFRPVLLVVLGLVLCASATHAAKFEVWVYVGSQTALVVPGAGTGGRVVWSPAHYCLITDRVSRGETVGVFYDASKPGEYARDHGWASDCGTVRYGTASLTVLRQFTVPTTPGCNNLRVWIQSNYENKEKGLPIGTRP